MRTVRPRQVYLSAGPASRLSFAVRHASNDYRQPPPMSIEEDEHEFSDVLGELHRRRKKMEVKRNRPVS
jgi:hypothetical protein